MIEKQKNIELAPIQELEIGVVEPKAQLAEADIQPQSLQFRIEIKRSSAHRKFFPFFIALTLAVGFSGLSIAMRTLDNFREESILYVKQLSKEAKSQKFSKITRPVLANVVQALRAHRPPKVEVIADSQTDSWGTCSAFITNALNKKVKSTQLSDDEFLHFVNCQIFQDSPQSAFQALQKKHLGIATGTPWESMRLSLLTLEVHRRMNPLSPLSIFPKQGCLRWGSLPDCLLRYVDESHASFKSRWQDGFKALEKEVTKKPPGVQAWFYLASGLYATKDHEFTKADDFLQTAFNAIKDDPNPYLEREIYRNATVNAYIANDAKLAQNALALMPVKRVEEAPNAFLDVELLEQLRGKDSRSMLQTYIAQSEAVKRFASDPRFLSIILNQTQRSGLENEGLDLANQIFGKANEVKAESIGESMVLVYARMWIGAGKSFEALEILTQLEKSGFRSAELYHLKGLAQLYTFKKPEIKLLAAKDFQTAAGQNKSDESLFALLIALLDLNERSKADQVMNQWKTLGPAAQKSIWYGFALGLVSYTGGNKEQAKTLWDTAEKQNKNNLLWKKLKSNVDTDTTYLDRDLAKNLNLLLGNDSPLGSLALVGQKS
ncbi:MAG: hypothetical protein H7318_17950 [Oligoflexus sp.]|nr:hypothetical protein [Oligoflexus sp.]